MLHHHGQICRYLGVLFGVLSFNTANKESILSLELTKKPHDQVEVETSRPPYPMYTKDMLHYFLVVEANLALQHKGILAIHNCLPIGQCIIAPGLVKKTKNLESFSGTKFSSPQETLNTMMMHGVSRLSFHNATADPRCRNTRIRIMRRSVRVCAKSSQSDLTDQTSFKDPRITGLSSLAAALLVRLCSTLRYYSIWLAEHAAPQESRMVQSNVKNSTLSLYIAAKTINYINLILSKACLFQFSIHT